MNASRIRVFLLILLALGSGQASAQFSKLVTFGDSLSDTGNIASISLNFPYPYYRNRISDGPVMADYIATAIASNANASLHLDGKVGGFNYAVAGGNIAGTDTEDLSAQVDAFLLRGNGSADPKALYLVIMGGNDIRGVRSIISNASAQTEMDQVLDTLVSQLQRLINAGARTFVIPNVANIGRLPETINRQVNDPGVTNRARLYTQYYNSRLTQRLSAMASSGAARITQLDLFVELETLVTTASVLGFRHIETGCFDLDGFDFHPDCNYGTRFDRFVFFDNLHPTGKTNRIISQRLIALLPTKPYIGNRVNIAPIISLLLSAE
ncbi:MAG: phospholipase/lecithinase/hemolysin [Cryomorphaceae bacterium]|jgi:phospholipase/lecithinase/hemolysin